MVGAERGAGDAQSFGSLLRQHRLATGLTREQLAERAGLGVRSIQDLERGIGRALRRTAAALAAALGLEPEALAAFRLAAAPGPRGHPIRPLAAAHGRPAG